MPLCCTVAGALLFVVWPGMEYQRDDGFAALFGSSIAGQFAHMDARHLLLNLVGLWLVAWGLKPWRAPLRDLLFLGGGLAGVAAGLLLTPEVTWYRGLSGALHGLFMGYVMLVLLTDARAAVKIACSVLLAGLAVKLWLEDPVLGGSELVARLTGWTPSASTPVDRGDLAAGKPVLYAAHRWGAAGGCLAGIGSAWRARMTARKVDEQDRHFGA